MAEVKNKIVTVESLAAVNTHNKETYMTKSDDNLYFLCYPTVYILHLQ